MSYKLFSVFLLFLLWGKVENHSSQTGICEQGDTVRINNQVWMTENLAVDTFQNGDTILHAPSLEEWLEAAKKGIPAWCYYNNNPDLGKRFGRLYNWYAASDQRGIAPKGWRVPSSKDIKELLAFLSLSEDSHWIASSLASKEWKWIRATDTYGFRAKPGGLEMFPFMILHRKWIPFITIRKHVLSA